MMPWWAALILGLVACWFTAWAVHRLTQAETVERRMQGLENAAARIDRWQQGQVESAQQRTETYKGMLYDTWRAMHGQQKGLQRQRRLINRLRREIEELKRPVPTGDSDGG